MTDTSLIDHLEAMKGDYQTTHESLCAKLRQAKDITKVTMRGNPTESELFHVLWGIHDMLEAACKQCDGLTAKDFNQDAS